MADAKLNRTFWELVRDTLVSLGVTAAFRAVVDHGVQKAKEELTKVLEDKRAELVEELLRMPEIEKSNLLRRHREAKKDCRENRFVTLLIKLYDNPTSGRRDSLKLMNDLSDDEFNQMLYMIEDDKFVQWATKARDGVVDLTTRELRILKGFLKRYRRKSVKASGALAEKITPKIQNLTEKLRARREQRERRYVGRDPEYFGKKRPWYCKLRF